MRVMARRGRTGRKFESRNVLKASRTRRPGEQFQSLKQTCTNFFMYVFWALKTNLA